MIYLHRIFMIIILAIKIKKKNRKKKFHAISLKILFVSEQNSFYFHLKTIKFNQNL